MTEHLLQNLSVNKCLILKINLFSRYPRKQKREKKDRTVSLINIKMIILKLAQKTSKKHLLGHSRYIL